MGEPICAVAERVSSDSVLSVCSPCALQCSPPGESMCAVAEQVSRGSRGFIEGRVSRASRSVW